MAASMTPSSIAFIVGLGNPDREHLTTRHNAGFWFVDALAERHGSRFSASRKLEGDIAEADISGHRVRLLKPATYMNRSGSSVAKALAYYKVPPAQLLIVHDELDFPPGRVKLKFGGGHAGHNGMRSVIEHVGADMWRLRIGVGHPGPGRRDEVIDHVLRRASRSDEELILEGIARALDCVPAMLSDGPERVMNQLHAPKPGAPATDEPDDD
jgi:PTH1 family peptidyl-tRNA hydrolase